MATKERSQPNPGTRSTQPEHLEKLMEKHFSKRSIESRTVYDGPDFALGCFNYMGGSLNLREHNVHLYIPKDAIPKYRFQNVYIYVDPVTRRPDSTSSDPDTTFASRIYCGPTGLKFRNTVVISFPKRAPDHDSCENNGEREDAESVAGLPSRREMVIYLIDWFPKGSLVEMNSCKHMIGKETRFSKVSTACPESKETATTYAETIRNRSMLLSEGSPAIYKIPLTYPRMNGSYSTCLFGDESKTKESPKVIMMVGETGAGKSTLINAVINYILGVKWKDGFRFKMIDEQGEGARSQTESQTQNITSYTIRGNEHHNIPYPLTIIDTPGYGGEGGMERDKAITDQIREFFTHPQNNQVDHIDGICVVAKVSATRLTPAQQHAFDTVQSLYGKNVKENILLLVTHSDAKQTLDTVKEADVPFTNVFSFNNSPLFAQTTESEDVDVDKILWQRGQKSMKNFFKALGQLSSKPIDPTIEVLENRKRLESLSSEISIAKKKMVCLLGFLKRFTVKANKPNEWEFQVNEKISVDYRAMNCPFCRRTCHCPCEESKETCAAMDHRDHCLVCPLKCPSTTHEYRNYKFKYQQKKLTLSDIKGLFGLEKGDREKQLVEKVKTGCKSTEKLIKQLTEEFERIHRHLQEIALKPDRTANVKRLTNALLLQECKLMLN